MDFDLDLTDFEFLTLEDDLIETKTDVSQFQLLYSLVAQKIKNFGTNKINSSAVAHLSKTNNIILVGPPRVGKSETIKCLSGKEVKSSPSLFSCTKKIEKFVDESMTYWDTPGLESWKTEDVESFMNKVFIEQRILPLTIIIVIAPGCFIVKEPIMSFINLAHKYKIQLIFEITKAYSLDQEILADYVRTILEMTGSSFMKQSYKFSKELDNNTFIVFCNLKKFESIRGKTSKPFGLNDLKKIIFNKQDPETKVELLKMYSENSNMLEYAGSFLFDAAYTLGVPVEKLLNEKEQQIYKEITKDDIRVDEETVNKVLSLLEIGRTIIKKT